MQNELHRWNGTDRLLFSASWNGKQSKVSSWLLLIYLQLSEQDNYQQSKKFSEGIIPTHKLNLKLRKGSEKFEFFFFFLNIVISSDSPQNVLV